MRIKNGIIITYILVFGAIFLILLGGLLGFILFQLRISNQKVAFNHALHIAEAGISYYRWCLNNEVGQNCELAKNYFDAAGNLVGSFSLEVEDQEACGQFIQSRVIATGSTERFPNIERKVSVLYARESIAKFSFILDSNVWIGSDHEIRGQYHSNGGIRFDGENQSIVTSARDTWLCTESFGCNPPQDKPGVFTTTGNPNPDLFDFPVPPFDFEGITVDLAQMKQVAQGSGIYLPPSKDLDSNGKGYHIKFKDNGTFEAWIITGLSGTWGYSLEENWHWDYFTITGEYLYNTYAIPTECSAIFVEDDIWPEGEVRGKVALASADLIDPNLDTDAVLQWNIDYDKKDGSDSLLVIGQRNVLIGPNSPDDMELRGIFVAQKGRFSRNHYTNNFRDKLEIFGTIISKGRVGTKWTSGGQVVSGYLKRETYFDANLLYNTPPFVPYASSDFKIVNWQQLQ